MKIEAMFCTKDQAIRLKELDINQAGSFFIHRDSKDPVIFFQAPGAGMQAWINLATGDREENEHLARVMIRAFSVGELGGIITSDAFIPVADRTNWPEWFNRKWDFNRKAHLRIFNPAMLADMIIYLLEQKIMSAGKINKQLLQ